MQFSINITLHLELLNRTILSACCVGSAIPKNPAVPKCVWTSAIRCIRWFPGILQLRYRGAAYSDAGRRKKQLIKWLCRNGFQHCQASQCSLYKAPVFRLLLKVAVHGTHECESVNCCRVFSPNLCGRGFDWQENGSGMSATSAGESLPFAPWEPSGPKSLG